MVNFPGAVIFAKVSLPFDIFLGGVWCQKKKSQGSFRLKKRPTDFWDPFSTNIGRLGIFQFAHLFFLKLKVFFFFLIPTGAGNVCFFSSHLWIRRCFGTNDFGLFFGYNQNLCQDELRIANRPKLQEHQLNRQPGFKNIHHNMDDHVVSPIQVNSH